MNLYMPFNFAPCPLTLSLSKKTFCVPSGIFGDRNYVFLALSREAFKGLLLFIAKSTYSVKPRLPLLFSALSHNKQFKETNAILVILDKEIKISKYMLNRPRPM